MNFVTPIREPIIALSTDGGTARELIDSVEAIWGPIGVDLAAQEHNAKCTEYITPKEDSLSVDWTARLKGRRGWLNPPFTTEPIDPWVAKCAAEYRNGARILLLCPVNLNADWWWDHIKFNAATWVLTPCMTADNIPTTMAIHAFGIGIAGRIGRFYWGERKLA